MLAWLLLALALSGCGGGSSATMLRSSPVALSSVQRELAALPCPPGVPTALWDTLTAELSAQLERRAAAVALTAGPPLDEHSRVQDLTAVEQPLGSVRLRWSYRNTGDYDQNSETNISDLTPIGRHFNKTRASDDWNTAQVADGDLNGEVNISDITPIGRCFLQTVTEYRVEFSSSGPQSGYLTLDTLQFNAGYRNLNNLLVFDSNYSNAKSGYYRVVPYFHDQRGIEGKPVYFGLNQPPTAVLRADPQVGQPPLLVSFDASDSSDPEQLELSFSWDWDGDGIYDLDSGSNPYKQHEYTADGDYTPRVRVTDSAGAQSVAELQITSHGWKVHAVAEGGGPVAAMINGKPAIIYGTSEFDPVIGLNQNTLCYAGAKVPVPASPEDWTCMQLDPTVQDPEYDHHTQTSWTPRSRPFQVDGRPAAFYYVGPTRLGWYFAHAKSPSPAGPEDWTRSRVCDDAGNGGGAACGFEIGGWIYVVFIPKDSDIREIRLARSLVPDPLIPENWEITTIAALEQQVTWSPNFMSAGIFNGSLMFACCSPDGMDLVFGSCDSLAPSGPGDWQVTVLATQGWSGMSPDLKLIEGQPMILSKFMEDTYEFKPRLARALVPDPGSIADWAVSMPFETAEESPCCWLGVTGTGTPVLLSVGPFDQPGVVMAAYPPGSGSTSLGGTWLQAAVNPASPWAVSLAMDLIFENDWLICVNTEPDESSSVGFRIYCATSNLPQNPAGR